MNVCVVVLLGLAITGIARSETIHTRFFRNKKTNSIFPQEVFSEFEKGENAVGSSDWVVDVTYSDEIDKTGWATAEFTTNPDVDAEELAYSTGFAEGFITRVRIGQHWNNTVGSFCNDAIMTDWCKKLHNFIQENIDWMKTQISHHGADPYWKEVKKVLLQLQGVVDGYENSGSYSGEIDLKPFGLLLIQLSGDLEDLQEALKVEKHFIRRGIGTGSCSAFIKLTEDSSGNRDLFTAHDTWAPFEGMLRIMKRFNFPNYTEVYSGYPGAVFSGDDYYILGSGLVTMETTIGNGNPDLWKFVTPQSVLEWLRTIIANRLAKSGEEWCKIFSQYNSGTYNNQWMVVDYNKFDNQEQSDILWVLEQLPGTIEYRHVTDVLLDQTYWPSYNTPYFKSIFNKSGAPAMVKKYGDWFTYDKNPRAKIFKRDHKKVTDMDSLIKLMRYNDFKNDPLSSCNCTPPYSAENTIAARSDLNDPHGVYPFGALAQRDHGATDVKATSSTLRKSFSLMAECGPTHDQQPIFQWSKSPYAAKSHEGHPDVFNFKPELFTWGK